MSQWIQVQDVYTAPARYEDYESGRKYNAEITPIDDRGYMTAEAGQFEDSSTRGSGRHYRASEETGSVCDEACPHILLAL